MVAFGALAGCDAGPKTNQPSDQPPVHVTEVRAATTVDLTATPATVTYGPLDPNGGSKVAPTTSFHIRFDRLLLPSTANRQALCVEPLLANPVGPSDCVAGIFSEPSYDPVLREITFRITSGGLMPSTRHQLTVYAADHPGGGIQAFDGAPLEEPFKVQFDVVDSGGVKLPYDLPPSIDYFCAKPNAACADADATCTRSVYHMLQGCSLVGCHGDANAVDHPDAGAPGQASELLRLDGTDNLLATAIDHAAHETQTGQAAGSVEEGSLRFGRSMAVLSTKGPGTSYLVYKVLANRKTPLTNPFPDSAADHDAPEITRLRSSVVVGMPMAPDTAAGAVLHPGEAEWLSSWLLAGGQPKTCP